MITQVRIGTSKKNYKITPTPCPPTQSVGRLQEVGIILELFFLVVLHFVLSYSHSPNLGG